MFVSFFMLSETATNSIKAAFVYKGAVSRQIIPAWKVPFGWSSRPEIFSILTQNQSQVFRLDLVLEFFFIGHSCS
jgi:hypothetical protein